MKEALNESDLEMGRYFIQAHQAAFDSLYTLDIALYSTPEKFQFALNNIEDGKTEWIVKFDRQKETLVVLSNLKQAICHLQMTETKLKFHLHTIGLQKFADGILSMHQKSGRGIFSKFHPLLSGKCDLSALTESPEDIALLKLLINMRHAASKAPIIYQMLKDPEIKDA